MPVNFDQTIELIKRSDNILLTTKQAFSYDGISGILALSSIISALGKNVDIAVANFNTPKSLKFFENTAKIKKELEAPRDFVISLDISKTKVASFSYDIDTPNNTLDIFISPSSGGFFSSRDVTSKPGKYYYDLIIVVDSDNTRTLGNVYQNNIELFEKTKTLFITHNGKTPNNTYPIDNITNETPINNQFYLNSNSANSVSELLQVLITKINPTHIDSKIATYLYTGIVSKTWNFQNPTVNAETLTTAAKLIELGANKQERRGSSR